MFVDSQVFVLETTGRNIPAVHHFGIYVKDNNGKNDVYHCAAKNKNEYGGCVDVHNIVEFTTGRDVVKMKQTDLKESDVIKKADELKEVKYSALGLFGDSCADFARKVTRETPFFNQKNITLILLGAGVITFLIFKK